MDVERHRALHDGPDHLITRRKLFISATAVLAHQLLQNEASAMLPSLEGSPAQPTKTPMVLMYHDINFPRPGNIDEEGNWVPPKKFTTQIETIQAAGYKVGTLSEALLSPGETVSLTFDDGLHTAYDLIFSYLQSKNIKATFFVPVDALLSDNTYYIEPEQIREMTDAGHEVGSHSFDHIPLTAWSTLMVRTQLRRSKEFLEHLIGKEVALFAYPNGKHNRHIAEEVQKAGYKVAFLSRHNTRLGLEPPLDRFELPRYWITGKTDATRMLPPKPSKTKKDLTRVL